MLTPDAAKAALAARAVTDPLAASRDAARALPSNLRPIAHALIGLDEDGHKPATWLPLSDPNSSIRTGGLRYEELSAADRRRILRALQPRLADDMDAAWELMARGPYLTGLSRRPFRGPAVISLWPRWQWLRSLLATTADYDADTAWFAAHAGYLAHYSAADTLGRLFAGAIDRGNEAVFDTLCATASGEHPIGVMGRHVTRGLLAASRPDGWEAIVHLLLAAQREEGLRQIILETADEAHPDAFRLILRTILDHNLTRFSATVRAAGVWLGLNLEAGGGRELADVLRRILVYLEDRPAREWDIAHGDGRAAYLALWATATGDVNVAGDAAIAMLADADVERRFAAAYVLGNMQLRGASSALIPALADADPRLTAYVCYAWRLTLPRDADGGFEALEAALPRLPKKAAPGEPLLWPGLSFPVSRAEAADLLLGLRGERPPQRLIPHLDDLSPYRRTEAVKLLAAVADDPAARRALLGALGDRRDETREAALKALSGTTLTGDELHEVEKLLGRRSGEGRRVALALLAAQPAAAALAVADRLLAARGDNDRLAGLELLGLLAEAGRAAAAARARARAYRDGRPDLSPAEADRLAGLVDAAAAAPPALADALGLAPAAERTPASPPRPLDVPDWTSATAACLKSLSALIHEYRDAPLPDSAGGGETLLGNSWAWLRFRRPEPKRPLDEDLPNFFLRDVWQQWWVERGPERRDADGLELLRAWLNSLVSYTITLPGERPQRIGFDYPEIAQRVLTWLIRLYPPSGGPDAALDMLESACRLRPHDVATTVATPPADAGDTFDSYKAYRRRLSHYPAGLRFYRDSDPTWSDAHHARFFRLLRWIDEPDGDVPRSRLFGLLPSINKSADRPLRSRPQLDDVLLAYRAGAATRADLFDQLLGERGVTWGYPFHDLLQLTRVRRDPRLDEFPVLAEVVAAARERILTIEVARGEMPTAATPAANALQSVYGAAWLVRILSALGPDGLRRTSDWLSAGRNRADALSHLLRICLPNEDDTPERTAVRLRQTGLPDRALLAAALFAPQWAAAVEAALGWPGLAEGVFWVHAHTREGRGYADQDARAQWAAEVEQRTPLSPDDLLEGAVDVAWFNRVYATLGDKRWSALLAEARYASRGIGHTRAVLFAEALLGRAARAELEKRIVTKRYQDAVRALGLLPLPPLGPEREAELLGRYQVIQTFLAGSKKFGAQRRASEALAARIGLDNLARAAGYPDALRLTWAMEGRETAEWLAGPQAAVAGGVSVRMTFNEVGAPELRAERAGRRLKAIPPAARKDPAVAELIGRAKAIETQQKRMRAALEAAMCREEVFYAAELRRLLAHPTLAPMLAQLVWVGAGGLGYPADGGATLLGHDGRRAPLLDDTPLRIAHPYDLFHTGQWHLWQRDCFRAERIQPFKQVFRELYLLTAAEQADNDRSRRYAGQQVQPRQAAALLNGRGWIIRHDEGVQRTFHERGIVATIGFLGDLFTPGEVEGVTLETVSFGRPGEWWKPLPLAGIPPLVFSEVMRDLDLVVSVAHSGGVDPEASASTVDSRAALLHEMLDLLRLGNARLEGRHALIEGKLGSYSVHLGSGVVHRRPGGAVCIIPVHGQHRGRLFLPFADDDPKTAEVISKVLLLSRDDQIRDPGILEQLTR